MFLLDFSLTMATLLTSWFLTIYTENPEILVGINVK